MVFFVHGATWNETFCVFYLAYDINRLVFCETEDNTVADHIVLFLSAIATKVKYTTIHEEMQQQKFRIGMDRPGSDHCFCSTRLEFNF